MTRVSGVIVPVWQCVCEGGVHVLVCVCADVGAREKFMKASRGCDRKKSKLRSPTPNACGKQTIQQTMVVLLFCFCSLYFETEPIVPPQDCKQSSKSTIGRNH